MNVGAGGGGAAAPAAGGAAAGGAAEAAPAEEKKEEGTFRSRHPTHPSMQTGILTRLSTLQPRRSLMRTWASVSSTKRSRQQASIRLTNTVEGIGLRAGLITRGIVSAAVRPPGCIRAGIPLRVMRHGHQLPALTVVG